MKRPSMRAITLENVRFLLLVALHEKLADAEDLFELRKPNRAEAKKPSIPLSELKRRLSLGWLASTTLHEILLPKRLPV
jgi:hypothetical protein